jgi:L-ribulose-5-phosphate 3-epimerase
MGSYVYVECTLGVEPVLAGYTEDDGFKWCIYSIQQCLSTAEEYGVLLALENHWDLCSTPEGQLRIKKAIDSPWLGFRRVLKCLG